MGTTPSNPRPLPLRGPEEGRGLTSPEAVSPDVVEVEPKTSAPAGTVVDVVLGAVVGGDVVGGVVGGG